MTRVFTVDSNNDLIIQGDGLMGLSNGLQATLQACEHAAKAQLGEMVLAVNNGVPNFQTIWQGAPNIAQFEAYLLRELQNVDGVIEVTSLNASASNNILNYNATIRTIYGEGAING